MSEERGAPPREPSAWDDVGYFLQDMAQVGQRMANRNLEAWRQVAAHMNQRPYTADDMTTDAATAMDAAIKNSQELWRFWTRVPLRQTVADILPTAFVRYSPAPAHAKLTYSPPDPVWIRAAWLEGETTLPKTAEIRVTGAHGETARALEREMRATLGPAGDAYELSPAGAETLTPGTYTGLVFITVGSNVRPLASLLVVVEGDQAEAE